MRMFDLAIYTSAVLVRQGICAETKTTLQRTACEAIGYRNLLVEGGG